MGCGVSVRLTNIDQAVGEARFLRSRPGIAGGLKIILYHGTSPRCHIRQVAVCLSLTVAEAIYRTPVTNSARQ
jgi:hypothetical protein